MKEVKTLFEAYLRGEISKNGFLRLRELVAQMRDEELSELMECYFENYEEYSTQTPDFETLFRDIQPRVKERKVLFPIRKWWSRAAVAAVLIIVAFSVSLVVVENRNLNSFISKGVVLTVATGERANLMLPDGTTVHLNADSRLEYPINFAFKEREVKLSGEAFFEVKRRDDSPFWVRTTAMDIKVLGTVFNVSAYEDDSVFETTLLQGSVQVRAKGQHESIVTLAPGHKAVVDKKSGKLMVRTTDLKYETAWRRGELVFRSSPLDEVLARLERFYGQNIRVHGLPDTSERFTGSFQERNLNDIIKVLQFHYGFKYRIIADEVIIQFN